MKPLLTKVKPTSGFSNLFHIALLVILPVLVFVLVRLEFVQLALSVVVLSKWRMLAVRPRFWAANVRANAVDIIVGISIVLFMVENANSAAIQLLFVVLYGSWLIYVKPASGLFATSVQASIGQLCGLMALYVVWPDGPLYGLTVITGLICFLAARHFFDAFNETYARLLSYLWGYFGAALAWILGHWLLFYGFVAQPALLLSALGYGLASLYYLDHKDRLSIGVRRQFIFIMLAIVAVVLVFSDWGTNIV
ncbi:MAG: hypothetical protein JWN38_1277 [Candidatus Saccharibacteria bacterium]|nr:hypothetical protein [Candidatus Saccharibacteria bacterium]